LVTAEGARLSGVPLGAVFELFDATGRALNADVRRAGDRTTVQWAADGPVLLRVRDSGTQRVFKVVR
jgi:hypothetical protein